MKRPWHSRTVALNVVVILAVRAAEVWVPGFRDWICGNSNLILEGLAALNLYLRSVTKEPMQIRAPKGLALWLALSASVLVGCASTPQNLDPNAFYARALDLVVNGREVSGAGVVARAPRYRIEIKSRGGMDLLLIRSCHREWTGEKVGSKGWFQEQRRYVYDFVPDAELEASECPLDIAAFDAKRGAHAWGYLDFTDPGYTLPADVKCNGESKTFQGVSVCQSRRGLTQSIQFPVPVLAKPDAGCELEKGKVFSEGTRFTYECPKGACFYTFVEKGPARRKHRLTSLCYSDLVVEGG